MKDRAACGARVLAPSASCVAPLLALFVACGSGLDSSRPLDGVDLADASAGPTDAGTTLQRDGATGSAPDASKAPVDADADPPAPDAGPGSTIVAMSPVSGTPMRTTVALGGPGVILMGGGTDTDAAFVWMHDTLAGNATTRLGNVIVLRADNPAGNAYTPYIYGLAPFQSVMTIYLGPNGTATPGDLALAAWYVDHADAVFFAGGDQASYARWKGSSLTQSLSKLYARGGVIGGTSAGCAIQGPFVYDAIAADAHGGETRTPDAIGDPYENLMSFTRDMFDWPTLPKVVTDTHFVTRDRFGRLAAFVAREYADTAVSSGVTGVGVDEMNALLVDKNGKAVLVQQPGASQAGTGAYVLTPSGPADTCVSGNALLYRNVKTMRLAPGQYFDFAHGCGTGTVFKVTVDGSTPKSPYSTSPYTAQGTLGSCP